MSAVIEVDSLRVNLGKREILRGISCRLGESGEGKAIGLLGPNGAGKATLNLMLDTMMSAGAGRTRPR